MDNQFANFPRQMLPFSQKTKAWRKKCVLWANNKTFFNYSLVRKSVVHKQINYNLLRGKINMQDIQLVLNPDDLKVGYIPDRILHYPIMNSKLNVLRGEESKRVFDFRVVVTNPLTISEIENNKKNELLQRLQEEVSDTSQSEDEFNEKLEKLNDYFTYEWQDLKEIRANALLNHYIKECDIPLIFNEGFMDAMAVGEEIYQCDIVGGEPVIERLNPLKVRVFKAGFVNSNMIGDEVTTSDGFYFDPANLFPESVGTSLLPYDLAGNLRVLKVYWKSKRKVKKVKSYNPETGEEEYNFYPEDYEIDRNRGEEEYSMWINEAWEGTMIGNEIFVNMRPRLVQYNRLSNPSRCHFGIIGSIYNLNQGRPFSLVDMMKPYNYLYDTIHDRLNKAIANNWGALVRMDLAKVPKGWEVGKWMYYAKVNHVLVEDSFKEGNYGAASGKLVGALNNASTGGINLDQGNYIQQLVNLLEFIKMEMAEVAGITNQREGQISNRETVGGVERATLQSSHITEWLFIQHDDVKKRVLECLLETAKIALKGRSKKFQYILSDTSTRIMEIDGDEFAEADYGLVVDNSNGTQELNSKLDSLAQAALQTQTLSFSTITKLYTSSSLAEKQRLIEKDEQEIRQRQQQAQQEQLQAQQNIAQAQMQQKQAEMQLKDTMNVRDNETAILIAQMGKYANEETSEDVEFSEEAKANLAEKIRQFDEKLAFDNKKLKIESQLKKEQINKKPNNTK